MKTKINRSMNKLFLLIIFCFVYHNSYAQSTVEEISSSYESKLPIDFGAVSLTYVSHNDKFFQYSYQYKNLSSDWTDEHRFGAITLFGSEISKTINTLSEFNIIKKSGKTIIFTYNDKAGNLIYVIIFSIKEGKYELNLEQSLSVSKIAIDELNKQ